MTELICLSLIIASIFDFLNPFDWMDWVIRLVLAVISIIVTIAIAIIIPKGKILMIIVGVAIAIYIIFYWGGAF